MEAEGEEEYVDLDFEKVLTWTGNAVIIKAGGEFRLPLIVPHPSILAIQFEVEGQNDIEFSLLFKDDQENDYQVLVEPVRVSDREGQLDIDTTGVCELLWSNAHAWVYSKTLSYQLQLAPKFDMQKKKWINAILTAAHDYRIVSAAEAAEQVDNSMRTLKQRTASLQESLESSKAKEAEAQTISERYTEHVKRLEEEVAAAKRHVEQAAADLASKQREVAQIERSLTAIRQISSVDSGITDDMLGLMEEADEPLMLIYEAYAGALFSDEEKGKAETETALDRAEFVHFLQEFGILLRGEPPEIMCGVFYGCSPQLSKEEFKRCIMRSALALAPNDEEGSKLLWLLAVVTESIQNTKMPALSISRRVKMLTACDMLADIIFEPEEGEDKGS
mmetsp:Transcript_40813/g.98916  ORF Transcript_40813/g.98916 Transcript_40813/m.98916 type:complete len:390 (-) Transcript_40813:454-1623(-)